MSPIRLMYELMSFATLFILATAQYGFSIPTPGVADFDPINDEIQGEIKNFIWIVNSTWQPTITGETLLDSDGHISLWITSFHGAGYTKCLAASVYSGGGGSWAWEIDLSDDEIDTYDGEFVYRLKPTVDSESAPYDDTEREVPSRGFRILKRSQTSSSSSQSTTASETSTSSDTSTASETSSTASEPTSTVQTVVIYTTSDGASSETDRPSTTTSSSIADDSTSVTTITSSPLPSSSSGSNTTPLSAGTTDNQGGLSAGAKGGIGAGVAVGALVVLGLALLFWRRRHRTLPPQQQHYHQPPAAEVTGTGVYYPSPSPPPAGMQYVPAEGYHTVVQPGVGNPIPPKYAPVSELASVVPPELEGSPYGRRDMNELGLNQGRM
ncbi:hypothetical protein BJY01DRAFT_248939 [Aspergillus pseudoustus]|uniref:Mid2 domain-containing protein n=1 Tax=Aspergillus pseudoustus TaxID=1810923 RepID=A0ABR4JV18_9EURO